MSEKSIPPMQYTRLGKTGMRVSRICLGCMSFGSSKWQSWVKDEKESIEMIKKAYEAGINFFDTADTYSNGESERVLGKALRELNAPRSRVVIATKVFNAVYDKMSMLGGPIPENMPEMVNRYGLSRKHIFDAVDASLERLGVEYIDLYQIHRLDHNVPMEEIMEALHDVVKSGKVRYIGASSMKAWELQKLNNIAEKNGWTKFVSCQDLYNLVYREDEREKVPYCLDAGIGWIPWSPLATGFLTGKNRKTNRVGTALSYDKVMEQDKDEESNNAILDRVEEVAKKYNASCAQVAIAWHFTKQHVSAPIVGISKIEQLYDVLGSLEIKLTEEDVKYLEEPYTPRRARF